MSKISEWFDGVKDRFDQGAVIAMLIAAAYDLLEATVPAAAATFAEYMKERQSPDGWTKEERIPFFIGQLVIIKNAEVGNKLIDKVVDFAIQALINDLKDELPPSIPE